MAWAAVTVTGLLVPSVKVIVSPMFGVPLSPDGFRLVEENLLHAPIFQSLLDVFV